MAASRRIDPLVLRRMVEAGYPYKEIAEHFGVTVSGVQQAAQRYGIRRQRQSLDHRRYIPWTLEAEHRHSGPATNLRRLSALAYGREIPLDAANTALRWANTLVEEGLDIRYDPKIGFYTQPATSNGEWHLKKIVDEVNAKIKDKFQ